MVDCPDCPFSADSRQGVAQHMNQKKNHDYTSYSQARSRLDSTLTESGGGEAEGGDPDGEGVEPVAAGDRADDPGPHHTSPAVHFASDGGGGGGVCPDCGGSMRSLEGGTDFQGMVDGSMVAGESDPDDRYCSKCDVLVTSDGTTVRRVRV